MTNDAADMQTPNARARTGTLVGAVKIGVSVAVLASIVAYADWRQIYGQLAAASWQWLLLGFVVKSSSAPLAALRWRAVAGAAGADISRADAMRVTWASLFLGQALPGALGGDLVRGWLTVRLGFALSATMLALAADRVAALVGVVIPLLAGLPRLTAATSFELAAVILAAAAAVCVAATGLAFADLAPLPGFIRKIAVVAALRDMVRDMRARLGGRSGAAALGWSVSVHLCTIGAVWCFAHAVGFPASLLDCLAVTPFSIIAAAMPVSLAGWGVREGAFAAGFALLGLPAEGAVAVSLLIGASVLLMSLPGGVIWLLWRRSPSAAMRNIA